MNKLFHSNAKCVALLSSLRKVVGANKLIWMENGVCNSSEIKNWEDGWNCTVLFAIMSYVQPGYIDFGGLPARRTKFVLVWCELLPRKAIYPPAAF